jgi:hypothetical protein
VVDLGGDWNGRGLPVDADEVDAATIALLQEVGKPVEAHARAAAVGNSR